jgi:predicted permease
MIKRSITLFVVFLALVYFLNSYISYFHFRFLLPYDLFRYPYSELSGTEVATWKFIVGWVIPSAIVLIFMYLTKFSKRVTSNWGTVLLAVAVFIPLIKLFILYFASFVPGGGFAFVMSTLLSYLSLPTNIALLVGTLKMFMSLKPTSNSRHASP